MEDIGNLAEKAIDENLDLNLIEKFFEQLPEKAVRFGMRVLFAAVVFLVGVQLIRIVRRIVKNALKKSNIEKGAVHFIDSFLKTALYVILIFMIGSSFGLDAASVVALIGSAGVAIGLAIQGSLSNFAGGVLILLLKPFKIGDYIKEDTKGNEGTVLEIELFYTKLKTVDNKIIVLPNGTLSNGSLTNVTACDSRRMDLFVGISYDSDIKKAKEVICEVLLADPAVLQDKECFAYVNDLGQHAVSIGIRCWFSMDTYWEGKWRVTEEIKYALDNAGIIIPYPQIVVHHEKESNHS